MTPEIPSPPRSQRLALGVAMFLITAAFGFIQPFVPLYFEAAGLNRDTIGLILGVGTGMALVIQPLLGRISDRLDARRPLMVAAALTAGCAYGSFHLVPDAAANRLLSIAFFVVLTTLGINGFLYLNAVGAVLVGRLASGSRGGVAYAGYRVWGSVGYILVVLFSGWLLNRGLSPGRAPGRDELNAVFFYGPVLFFVIAGVSLLVPDRRGATRTQSDPANAKQSESRVDAGTTVAPSEANFRRFLVAYFLYILSLYGASQYLSLFMKSLGATPLWITGTFAAGVVCEVLVMTRVGRWTDRFGRRPALAFAFLIMPLRLLLYIPATGPLWVLLVQTLHGLNFGIMGAVAIALVNDTATDRDRGAAQARLIASQGLATAIGPVLCGLLAQHAGFGAMFGGMAAVGAVAAVLFLRGVHETHPEPEPLAHHGPRFLQPLARLLQTPPDRT